MICQNYFLYLLDDICLETLSQVLEVIHSMSENTNQLLTEIELKKKELLIQKNLSK